MTTTQASFIIQKRFGRDNWQFIIDMYVIRDLQNILPKSKNSSAHKEEEMTGNPWVHLTSLETSKCTSV